MRAWFTGRRGIFTWTAIGVIVAVVVAVTVVVLLPRDRTIEAEWADSTLEVTAFDTAITVTELDLEPDASTALASAVPSDFVVLRPLEISADGEIPDSGVTLTLTLAEPLPEDAAATFAYYDEEIAVWVPELTTVSEDRRTLTAVVDHLSLWTVIASGFEEAAAAFGDFVEDVAAGVGEAMERGSQQLFRFTHELLGNAADTPECTGTAPWWVQETLLSDNNDIDLGLGEGGEGTNAVLLCVGASPENPDLLEVKAAANRGYGFPVTMSEGVVPLTSGPSGMDPTLAGVLQFASSFFVDAGSLSVIDPNRFVYATQEYAATFDEQSLRAMSGGRILSFDLPGWPQLVLSSAIKVVLDAFEGNEVVAGILTVLSMVRDCDFDDLATAGDAAGVTAWLATCASSLDHDNIAKALDVLASEVEFDDEQLAASMKQKANLIRAVAAKVYLVLIATVAQTVIDYIGDSVTENVSSYPAWFVNVVLAPERPALEQMYGRYTYRDNNGFFTTMKADAEGIDIVDCNGCGSVSKSLRLVNPAWNGSCYEAVNQVEFDGGDGTRELYHETWMLCPKGFGGPGDDGVDRIGEIWQGKAPANWYRRD